MKNEKNLPLLLIQIPIALLIIAFVPTNLGKLAAFLVLWAVTFRKLSRAELIFYVAVCTFFTAMNAASLKQGIFAFAHPDVLGMPIYELAMWGFYLLHIKRVLGGPEPEGKRAIAWTLAIFYAISFATIPDAITLLAVTGTLLLIGLVMFHEPHDLAYTGYLILLGAAFEYTGVHSGEWIYPGGPVGGVPFWFVTLWGGVGLFMRRLVVPILMKHENKKVTHSTGQPFTP
jgi:hypothetical protein